jgi:hypothetical protein
MSIGTAILAILDARGVPPAVVADRISTRDGSTFYRVLSGETSDPRISTLLQICDALMIGPTDLLELAGLYGGGTRQLRLIDVELRQAFNETQQLDEDGKRECLTLLRGVIGLHARRARRRTPR